MGRVSALSVLILECTDLMSPGQDRPPDGLSFPVTRLRTRNNFKGEAYLVTDATASEQTPSDGSPVPVTRLYDRC